MKKGRLKIYWRCINCGKKMTVKSVQEKEFPCKCGVYEYEYMQIVTKKDLEEYRKFRREHIKEWGKKGRR